MPDNLTLQKRMHLNTHNGHLGCVAMSKSHMRRIINSPSTTMYAQRLAQGILRELELLSKELHVRVELDGRHTHFQTTAEKEREAKRAHP